MRENFSVAKIKYLFYTLTHPMDGFYEIRHRGRGSVPIAVISVILFSFVFSINKITASFIVKDSLDNLSGVLLLYLLFCVGNWSITCLLNGEGRLKDIATVLGYSLVPITLSYVIATIVSQVIAQNEEGFYSIIITIGTLWTVLLALSGIMIVHNYSLAKTLLTLILTVVSMLIIVFVVMLLSDLVSQVYGFIYSIYTELLFRS